MLLDELLEDLLRVIFLLGDSETSSALFAFFLLREERREVLPFSTKLFNPLLTCFLMPGLPESCAPLAAAFVMSPKAALLILLVLRLGASSVLFLSVTAISNE